MRKKVFKLFMAMSLMPGVMLAQAKLVEKVSKKGNEIVIPYEKYVLPNGLTVIIHEDHSDPIAHVDITYHVGSAREEIGKSGFAHFFEHMMFQGSDNVGDDQHFKLVTESGGTLNGSTNRDRTNYFQTVPSNQVEKMIWLEADRMGFLVDAVTQRKFENQRSTVKNERGQNYDNRPYGLSSEVAARNLYPYGHPYSWLTIGYVEDLNRVNVNDLKNFFLRWYGPNNATLTVGGDVTSKQVLEYVQKYFGSIPRGPEVKPTILPPVKLSQDRFVSYVDNYAKSPQLRITWPTVRDYDNDVAPLTCLAQILGQGKNSTLYQNLIKTLQATNANAFSQHTELAGEFSISVSPYPGKTLTEMHELVKQSLLDFEKKGISDDDIQKFKSRAESGTINSLSSVSGKVSRLAAFNTFTGNPNMIGKLLEMNQKVTKADVMRVYEKYIKNKSGVILSILPKGKDMLPAAADNYTIDKSGYKAPDYGYAGLKYTKPKDNFDRSKIPASTMNPVVKVPAFYKKSLANGMGLIGTKESELPVVGLSIYLKGGKLAEANDLSKSGVASLFSSMMEEDTKVRSAEEFSQALEAIGSNINVSSSTDAIIFSVSTLKKNLDKTLKLLEERMLQPSFNEANFKRLKSQLAERLKNSKTQASSVADAVYAKLNYGNTIAGLPASGTEESIKNISLADIQNFYNNYISSDGGRVVVVGDISEAEILPKLSFLQKLPATKINLPSVPTAPAIEKTRIYLVDIPRAAQTEFRIGMPTGLKYDATGEYYRAMLTNYNLGSSFTSRLNLNLREDKGWTYGARSSFSGDKYNGTFTFSSGIRADATDSAVYEVMSTLKNYALTGIKDDEIKFMQSSLGQLDARSYETNLQKAGFLERILRYDLTPDYVSKQNDILKKISKSEIDQIAAKYLQVEKLNILLVGDKEKIKPGLERLGYEIVELDTNGNKL